MRTLNSGVQYIILYVRLYQYTVMIRLIFKSQSRTNIMKNEKNDALAGIWDRSMIDDRSSMIDRDRYDSRFEVSQSGERAEQRTMCTLSPAALRRNTVL